MSSDVFSSENVSLKVASANTANCLASANFAALMILIHFSTDAGPARLTILPQVKNFRYLVNSYRLKDKQEASNQENTLPQHPQARLLINKHELSQMHIEALSPPAAPASGEVLLAPDLFSLTTNNVTYAAYGVAMRYWEFFPTGDADWGQVPVWGFANVVASAVDDISEGERFYGYFPPASVLRVQAANVGKRGFRDSTAHRQALPAAYNQYLRCAVDPLYTADTEAFQAIYRPLFIT